MDSHSAPRDRYLTVTDPRYDDRVYQVFTTLTLDEELEVLITDGGNTVEDLNGNIIGHFVGTY